MRSLSKPGSKKYWRKPLFLRGLLYGVYNLRRQRDYVHNQCGWWAVENKLRVLERGGAE
ncbi:hypothetical protein [Desulfosporosinus acidiphilus]|uniref:hypothetical protein n=1 Tax=Desulfosporosinus acidiphilus TaxID=885581 RepID=UPI0002E3FDCF|nr:hypothetical protein [Desulfosporosinus acidiphilus]